MPPSPPARVVVAVADPLLRERVARLAAVAGVTATPLADADAGAGWGQADAVVVDDAVACAATSQLPAARGARVLVVTSSEPAVEVWRAAVHLGADAVAELPRDEVLVTTWLARTGQPAPQGRLVTCLGARGGAGASTFAAAMALAAAGDGPAMLVDLDPAAGGLDLLLGIEGVPGPRWEQLADACGAMPVEPFTRALPSLGDLRVVSGSPSGPSPGPAAVQAVVDAGVRSHDLVVVDLPPLSASAADAPPLDAMTSDGGALVLVCPAEVRATRAAAAGLARLAPRAAAVHLIVRHPGPGDLRPHDVAEALGLDLGDVWPWDRRLGRLVDAGTFARAWRRTSAAGPARRLSAALAVGAS